MAKMALPVNQKALKSAAKVAGFVGAGAILAQAGSSLAKRASAGLNAFAGKSTTNEAIVDAAAGIGLGAVGLMVYAKVKSPAAAKAAAPFVLGGAILSAAAPVVMPYVMGGVESLISKVLPAPGGSYRERMPGGVSSFDIPMLNRPGGVSSFDIPMAQPGGVSSFDVPNTFRRR